MLEAFLDLKLPELLSNGKSLQATKICSTLGLDLTRGWKFLHSLALSGMLMEEGGELGQDTAEFSLSNQAVEWFGVDGTEGYYWRDLIAFWKYVNYLNNIPFTDMLKGVGE